MMIDLTFAHLHGPLFFDSKSWGDKLDTKNTAKGKFTLTYNQTEKELIIKSGDKVAIIPTSNVASMTPMPTTLEAQARHEATPALNPLVNPPKRPGRSAAQVSTPMDHASKGLGFGKTND